jgi:hypothetical protein
MVTRSILSESSENSTNHFSLLAISSDRKVLMMLQQNLRIGRLRDGRFIAVLAVSLLVAFFAYIARLSDVTHDAFHEMALVRVFAESGTFPLRDVFAFTPTIQPAVHHEWGTGLVLYWCAGISPLGLNGMAVLRVLIVLAIAAALYRCARNGGAHPLLFVVCAPILFPLLWVGFGTIRAQIFTLLFILLQILMQQSDWHGQKRWVFAWSFLYIVWLNMHAGFVVGIGLMFFHVVERWLNELGQDWSLASLQKTYFKLWHHLLLPPILVIGLQINPWGLKYGPYLLRAISMPRPTMLEWQPLWMTHDNVTAMAAFSLSVLALGYIAKNRRWTRLRGWLFCCVAAYMALKHLRHGSIYAVVWMAYMPGWLTPTAFGRTAIATLVNCRNMAIRIAVGVSIACLAFILWNPIWQVTMPNNEPDGAMVYPTGAVQYLKAHSFSGNLMTPFASGAYVSWMCYPAVRVSIDGRYEVAYRDDVLPKHNQFYSASQGWEKVLDEYPADVILVQANAPVKKWLGKPGTKTEAWRVVYEDAVFSLYANNDWGIPVSTSAGINQPGN